MTLDPKVFRSTLGKFATGVTVVSATQIYATTPAHAAGAVDVTVTNPDTQSGTLTNGYTYTGPGVCPAPDLGGWYPGGWLYRKPLSIGASNVSSDLTNFPVLVSIPSDTDLAADAQPDFDDILFTASDGTTKLSHEIEKYNSTTGELVAWVKVPTISSTADTILYMYYGNAAAASQQDPTGVWSNGYAGVWHLHDDFLDSTANNNDGTNSGSVDAAGKIGDGSDFLSSNTSVDVPDSATLDLNSTVTVSVWFNPRVVPPATSYQRLVAKSTPTNASPYSMYGLLFDNDGNLRAEVATGGSQNSIEGAIPVQAGTWQYGTMTYDGTDLKLYYNAAEDATPTTFSGSIDVNNVQIGRAHV
jgi:biopolymer transport protein ExbB